MPRHHRDPRSRSSTDVTVERVYGEGSYVRVNTIGTTGERAFVLIPGIGVSSTYFERLAPNLNEFGPVHALDLPGFGGVPHPGRALSIRQYADLVGAVIDELGLVDPIIVGHSMGTQVVSDLVSRRPEISTLILISPVVNADERRIPLQAIRFLQASWHEPLAVKILAISAYLLCGFRWFSRILPRMLRYPIEKRMPDIQAHTLIIRGEHDAVSPRAWVERLGELLPLSRQWEMPGAAHSVMHAHAEEVALLCVEHARQAETASDDGELHHFPEEHLIDQDDVDPTIDEWTKGIGGRITETIGSLTGDDDMIAEGKTAHAEAMAAAHGDSDGESGSATVAAAEVAEAAQASDSPAER